MTVENLLKTLQFISIQPIWDTTWSVSHREYAKNPVVLHPLRYGPAIKQTNKHSWFQTHLQTNIVNKSTKCCNLISYTFYLYLFTYTFYLNETCMHPFYFLLSPWFHKKKHPILSFTTSPLSYRPRGLPFLRPGLDVDTWEGGRFTPPQSTKTHGESDKPPGCNNPKKNESKILEGSR